MKSAGTTAQQCCERFFNYFTVLLTGCSSGLLLQGLLFVCSIVFTSVFFSFLFILKKRKISAFFSAFFTPGFFVFLLIYISLIILHYGRLPYQWDEFSHWASVVKCMVSIDAFVTNPATSQMLYRSYVPGMALFQYILQKIISAIDPSVLSVNGHFTFRITFSQFLFSFRS